MKKTTSKISRQNKTKQNTSQVNAKQHPNQAKQIQSSVQTPLNRSKNAGQMATAGTASQITAVPVSVPVQHSKFPQWASKFKTRIFLAFIIFGVLAYIIGDAISSYIQLPPFISILLKAIGSFLALLGIMVAVLTFLATRPDLWDWFVHDWQGWSSSFKHAIRIVLVTVLLLVIVLLSVFSPVSSIIRKYFSPQLSQSLQLPSLPPDKWKHVFQQSAPFCDTSLAAKWMYDPAITYLSCRDSGLAMQLTAPDPRLSFTQLELSTINGKSYDQTSFRAQVRVFFPNPNDQPMTTAALHVQGQRDNLDNEAHAGYIFELAPTGHWQLQQFDIATRNEPARDGITAIDPSQPIVVTLAVQNHFLYALVNNNVVCRIPNNGPSTGIVGLLVGNNQGYSSPVIFSKFELDT